MQEAHHYWRACVCSDKDVTLAVLPFLHSPSLIMKPCFSCRPRPPPQSSQLLCSVPQPAVYLLTIPSGYLHTANPRPLPGTDGQSLSFITQPLPGDKTHISGYGVLGGGTNGLSGFVSALPSSSQLPCFSLRFLRSLCLSWSPYQLGGFPGCGFLSSFTDPSQEWECWSHPDSLFFFFFFNLLSLFFPPLFYPVTWRISCPFWWFKVFCWPSEDVLCELFYMQIFFWCVCVRRWAPHLTLLPSWSCLLTWLFWN